MPQQNDNTPVEILLVEDSADDADLMMEALQEGELLPQVHWVEDGEQALAYLRREGGYARAVRPDLILLDLRLPKKNGREVLDEIKQDPELRRIPVVVMTGNEAAITEIYRHYPNCCVAKPADQDQFTRAVQKIEHFWFTVAARVLRK